MIKLGITGLIGSGKSTVTNILNKKGIPTFCADKTVYQIFRPENVADEKSSGKLSDQIIPTDL